MELIDMDRANNVSILRINRKLCLYLHDSVHAYAVCAQRACGRRGPKAPLSDGSRTAGENPASGPGLNRFQTHSGAGEGEVYAIRNV